MRFAATSTPEQKREFLACLGIEQFVIYADVAKLTHNDIREVLRLADNREIKPSGKLKALAEKNIFIFSNREFCHSLLNVANLFNTQLYAQNLDYVRSNFNDRGWSKTLNGSYHEENKKNNEAMGVFVKFIAGVLTANDLPEMTAEVDSQSLRVLVALYKKKSYASHEYLMNELLVSKRQITFSIKTCLKKLFVQEHPGIKTREYQITATGILAVNRFIEKVIKMINF